MRHDTSQHLRCAVGGILHDAVRAPGEKRVEGDLECELGSQCAVVSGVREPVHQERWGVRRTWK
jgi:hypothetical protein